MRTKFLSIIIGFFAASFALTSCLSSTEPVSYDVDVTIKSFSFDSIQIDKTHYAVGRKHPFSIDQIGANGVGLIYNADSLPVNTNLSKVKLNISTSGFITYPKNGKDTLWSANDTLDLRKPIKLTVNGFNSDGTLVKQVYDLTLNVHKQDPDSLDWGKNAIASAIGINGPQKSVILNNKVYLFEDVNAASLKVYSSAVSDGKTWVVESPMTGIADKMDYSSVTVFNNKIYAIAGGSVYTSTDAIAWTKQDGLGANVNNLLVAFDGKLSAIATIDGVKKFCVTTNGATWAETSKEAIPANFPTMNTSAVSYSLKSNNLKAAMLMGDKALTGTTDLVAVPWSTLDGLKWVSLESDTAPCPKTTNISIIFYNNRFYAFGGKGDTGFNNFYSSEQGIIWKKVTQDVCFPTAFKGRGDYSFVVDGNNFIWLMWSKTATSKDEVWKGRVNSLNLPI